MFNLNVGKISCRSDKQKLYKYIVAAVTLYFIYYIFSGQPETAHFDILGPVYQMKQKKLTYCTGKVLKRAEFPFLEYTEHDIVPFLCLIQKLFNLRRMVLQIIIHSYHKLSMYILAVRP